MAKIIWLGNELILMMDSNFFHRHGTTIGGVSIEGKDDDDNMHANNFNQGGVLHSTVAFGYLSQCRTLEFRCCAQIRPLKKESTWPQCVFSSCSRCTTTTCCGAHVCNWPPPQVVWASLRAWARWAGRTLELLKLRRGSHLQSTRLIRVCVLVFAILILCGQCNKYHTEAFKRLIFQETSTIDKVTKS